MTTTGHQRSAEAIWADLIRRPGVRVYRRQGQFKGFEPIAHLRPGVSGADLLDRDHGLAREPSRTE